MKDKNTSQSGGPDNTALPLQKNPLQRILVTDDDDDVRRLGVNVLINHGYHVDAAEDGAVAWAALQLNNYNLLITDNSMPKMSGIELLEKIHAARMALPVIMATGTLPEEFARSPWLQPAAVLVKPYTADALLGTVKEVLRATADVREPIVPVRTELESK